MYRKSSKGNPYHDERGRFTSAGGKLVPYKTKTKENPGGIVIDAPVEQWSSFGEVHTKEEVLSGKESNREEIKNKWIKRDADVSHVAVNDGRRHYHNQSISREKHAKSLANVKIPKGLSTAEKQKYAAKSLKNFMRENKYALKYNGEIITYRKGNSSEITYQVVQSNRMKDDVSEKAGNRTRKNAKVTRNTSTSMKQFSGYTVEFTKNNLVRSCPKNASAEVITDHIEKFCNKHKAKLSGADTCIKIWTDKEGRVRYSASFHFDDNDKAKAEEFAKQVGGIVVSHDDGSQA